MDNICEGNVKKVLVRFAIPYMIAAFMQTLYGLVDLFVVGLYNTPATTTAVSVGSQIMHMLTVIILGIVLGTTVHVGNGVGAKDEAYVKRTIGTSTVFFTMIAVAFTVFMLIFSKGIVTLMMTPVEAVAETNEYLYVCFFGIPFIFAFNTISGVFRGLGDSKSPMYAVFVACIVNIGLDFLFVGSFKMGARGAAFATVVGQIASTIAILILFILKNKSVKLLKTDFKIDKEMLWKIIGVGTPVALQDGFIQVAFIVITVIANARGLTDAAGVGVVEKLICFFFLVPSSFLSAISAITAQNAGAGKIDRARESLRFGIIVTVSWGALIALLNQIAPEMFVGLFTKDADVLRAGCTYMRSYSTDTMFAAIHFCFSGYFCGMQRSYISFVHNLISVLFIRIPGSYLASKMFVNTLYPMGWAAPVGSLVSAAICAGFFIYYDKKDRQQEMTKDFTNSL